MQTIFSTMRAAVEAVPNARRVGRVSAVIGLRLTVTGLDRALGIGTRCTVHGEAGPVPGEVVGVDAAGAHILPFGTWDGVGPGTPVEIGGAEEGLRAGPDWIGRVIDALGRPVDGRGPLPPAGRARPVRAAPPSAFARRPVGARLETGVRTLDVFAPLCHGQRMGIFAGSGVGKSTLMSMLARRAETDAIVVGLVGERGREVQDFIRTALGEEGLARSILVVATGDEAPLLRRQAAWTATAVAEALRDAGMRVLLMIDSVTRFAQAQREIGLSLGEPPAARGFPPSVFSELPQLLERAGPGSAGQGDITALYTVLVDGDDMNDPVADAVRGTLDGHLVLSRRIAERGRYPAVDLERSLSRMLPDCHSDTENAILGAARAAIARYTDMEELIRLGAYRRGTDAEVDRAILFAEAAEKFLAQGRGEATPAADAFAGLARLLDDAGWPRGLSAQPSQPA
ncbi:FliI/YscN family ATPase [Roseivivax isoporae]|uniref:ATP synthase n=1 Tax=Roseivivax isoporae LMG 25204 TaxID=1449351 RepID=X7F7Z1_9RHOB|nr:FliI/YscN family ATPase [Roseivivax isoporae]ETX28920.1 ATP synthase [Roseivivax isoporae LMG 25204]